MDWIEFLKASGWNIIVALIALAGLVTSATRINAVAERQHARRVEQDQAAIRRDHYERYDSYRHVAGAPDELHGWDSGDHKPTMCAQLRALVTGGFFVAIDGHATLRLELKQLFPQGRPAHIGFFADSKCTEPIAWLDFGEWVHVGAPVINTAYVKPESKDWMQQCNTLCWIAVSG